ncbi:YolD-like family protein [Neobacillus terrae]|uniref:YolD-like family protein n=1 Tax=Neobacillus terrae TaxID=3034837 RepID=UPI00140A83B3|nr:YolD-like family protein [Neobacillus terrae]NHM30875.1 YolD-like family protein [Neobacillus terrae]
MGIRGRGKIKWQPASFLPDQLTMIRKARLEDSKVEKPLLDEYQWEEIEQKLLLAMEFASKLTIKIWEDGFFYEYKGLLHRLDEMNKVIYLEMEEALMVKIRFFDISDVFVNTYIILM